MKPFILILFAFGLLTASMQSSIQYHSNYDRTILGTWSFDRVEFVFDASIDDEEKEFIEMFMVPMLEEGLSYVQMSFYEDGTMRTLVDSPDENSEDIGSWQLSADGRTLTLHSEEGSDAHSVHLLTDTDLILSMEDEDMKLILHLKKV